MISHGCSGWGWERSSTCVPSAQTISTASGGRRWTISGCPVADTHAPTVDQIVQGLAWIEQHVQTGRKVYIHCAAGMGRSVTLLACWYLYTGSMNVSQVLTFVKRRRPQTSLRRRQVWRIQEIATLLTHTAGKLPVQVSH